MEKELEKGLKQQDNRKEKVKIQKNKTYVKKNKKLFSQVKGAKMKHKQNSNLHVLWLGEVRLGQFKEK